MQHSLTNHVVALAQLQAGSEPLGFDCSYRAQENLQTIFKNQAFRQYHAPKHLTQSPASTVSDRSDHSDNSAVSENSSQTEYSESEDSPSAYDCLSHAFGTAYGNQHLPQSATSSLATELQQSNELTELGCDQSVSAACHLTSRSAVSDEKQHEPSQLAYRTRTESTFEAAKPSSCITDGSRDVESDLKVEPFYAEKPSHISAPRCYPSLLNPFTGFISTRSTPTGSPQNVQTNSRRRSVNPALPPPKLRRDTDNTDAIVRMIVIFCTNLIQSIWPVDTTSGASASACQGATQPGGNVLPLQVFITETLRRSKTSYSTLQIALFYLILLKQCLPELANPGQGGQPGCRAMLCGRRMFLTALILASKYLQDRNYSARAWSKISGLPMKEINDNERRYLRFVGWDLHVPKDAFENWSKIVLAICRLSTGQDFSGQDPNNQPPAPPAPCIAAVSNMNRKGQLQDMCPDSQTYAVRAWWVFNLQSLRTDVVRCPRKTEQYVLSIPQLKGVPTLTRPLFENRGTKEAERNCPGQEILRSVHKLPKYSSMEFTNTVQPPVTGNNTPGTSKIMPPPPPTLGTLPTPQTTPRSDIASPYGTTCSRSSSRCRDSASLLRGLDRPCLRANTEMLPIPRSSSRPPSFLRHGAESQDLKSMMSQPSPGAWLPPPFRARDYFRTPDASLTSSPESTVSDLSSMSGFVGRSRTSSFSSTSSRSNMTQLSATTSDPARCEGFKKQLNSIDAQIAPRVCDWRNTSIEKSSSTCTPQTISRPQTAFRTSVPRPEMVDIGKTNSADSDSESVTDEGYWSSDYSSQAKCEERKRQTAAQALVNMQLRANAELTPTTLKNLQPFRGGLPRPVFTRSSTQVYAPAKPSATTQHTLKRSRSESFDHSAEPYLPDLSACNSSHAQARNVQQSCQPWADSKQPVLCGTQDMNKRIAVQSAAATRASADLRKEACSWSELYSTMSDGSKTKLSLANDCLVENLMWQPCGSHVQEVHL